MDEFKISKLITFDYYDGAIEGAIYEKFYNSWYYFYLIDWDNMRDVRIHALFSISNDKIDTLFNNSQLDILKISDNKLETWLLKIDKKSKQEINDINKIIKDIIKISNYPDVIVAWYFPDEILKIKNVQELKLNCHFLLDKQYKKKKDWFNFLDIKND